MTDKSPTTDPLHRLEQVVHVNGTRWAAQEIYRLRARLAKIEHAPVDPNNTVAMTLKGWAAPRDGEPANG